MLEPRLGLPDLGVGVGLRSAHHDEILARSPAVDWFECVSENFLVEGGRMLHDLDAVRARYPVVLHGVSLNLGGPDPLDRGYLKKLRALIERTGSPWASDHLCWNGASGVHLHELMPMPMTEEAVRHLAGRIRQVQDALGVRFAVENVSSYLTYRVDAMPEWTFLSAVAEEADCGLLLDVNNVFVSSQNHGFDPHTYLAALPAHRVVQMHLAGHLDRGTHLLDSHSARVRPEVWSLFQEACRRVGPCSVLIEWDDDLPTLDGLLAEADRARRERAVALGEAPVRAATREHA